MPSRFDAAYRVKRDTRGKAEELTPEFFDGRFQDVDGRLTLLEALKISWEQALLVVQDAVLDRSEDVIAELRNRLLAITQLQWLTALSTTPATLLEGAPASFVIDNNSRALFAPGPFSIVGPLSDPTAYAIVSTIAYGREVGQWDVNVVAVVGDLSGPRSDWSIGALAGSTLVQLAFLNEAKALQAEHRANAKAAGDAAKQTALDRTATGQDRAATGQDRTATGQDRAQTGQDRTATGQDRAAVAAALAGIAAGPVYGVNGQTGNVNLGAHDVDAYTRGEVDQAVAAIKGGADATHDTLGELAALVEAQAAALAALAKRPAGGGSAGGPLLML